MKHLSRDNIEVIANRVAIMNADSIKHSNTVSIQFKLRYLRMH